MTPSKKKIGSDKRKSQRQNPVTEHVTKDRATWEVAELRHMGSNKLRSLDRKKAKGYGVGGECLGNHASVYQKLSAAVIMNVLEASLITEVQICVVGLIT